MAQKVVRDRLEKERLSPAIALNRNNRAPVPAAARSANFQRHERI